MSSETREIMHDQHSHPVHGTRTYWTIGVILFFVTAFEILAYYMEDRLGPAAVPTILILSAAKFALVVMFFMHLKTTARSSPGSSCSRWRSPPWSSAAFSCCTMCCIRCGEAILNYEC